MSTRPLRFILLYFVVIIYKPQKHLFSSHKRYSQRILISMRELSANKRMNTQNTLLTSQDHFWYTNFRYCYKLKIASQAIYISLISSLQLSRLQRYTLWQKLFNDYSWRRGRKEESLTPSPQHKLEGASQYKIHLFILSAILLPAPQYLVV